MSSTRTWRRRATALTAGIAVAALALTACSSGGGSSAKTAQPVSQSAIDKAMHTPTNLTFWTWVPDITNEVALFEKAYPDIKVKVVNVGQGADHYKKLRSAIQAGKGAPDVAQMEYQYVSSFSLGDNLLDLSPYIPSSTKNDYVPWVWQQVLSTDGKKVYGIPQDSGPMGLLYRDDLFKAAGIQVPKTWSDFATAAKTLHTASPNVYITDLPGNDMGQFAGMLWQIGARPFGWDGAKSVTIDVNSAKAQQLAKYWQDLIQAGLVAVDPDFTDAWYQGLANGKYASWAPTAAWGPVFLQGTAAKTSGLWRAAEAPQWSSSGKPVSSNWGGSSDAVMKTTKNPIAAAQFALWLNHDATSTLMMANKQFLFPTTNGTLQNPAFSQQAAPFYGGQQVNKLFADISKTVPEDFHWLPFMDYAYSSGSETVGKAIANKGDMVGALKTWQDQLVSYAKQQGFTVK
jgi:multiple sugar transport system substrate-binding protein